MELTDVNTMLSDQCGMDWLSIPGIDAPVALSSDIQETLAFQDRINREEGRLKPIKKPRDKLDFVVDWLSKLSVFPLRKSAGNILGAPGFEAPPTARYRPNPYNIRGDLRAMSGYNESDSVDVISRDVEADYMSQ